MTRVRVEDYGAIGDGVADDGPAMIAAVAAIGSYGGVVVFTPGRVYRKTTTILVTKAGTTLFGPGATITTDVPAGAYSDPTLAGIAIRLQASKCSVVGLSFTCSLTSRLGGSAVYSSAISVESSACAVVGCTITGTNLGILAIGVTDCMVAWNRITRTWADGIHIQDPAVRVAVIGNVVRQTGDDMIAVVDIGVGASQITGILVEDNDLSDQYWGRGINVSGGSAISVRRNRLSKLPYAAGILVAPDAAFGTANTANVLVELNTIEDCQTLPPTYDPVGGHSVTLNGAIDVYAPPGTTTSQVAVRNNTIRRTIRDGISVHGAASHVSITGNAVTAPGAGRYAVAVSAEATPVEFSGNTSDASPATSGSSSPASLPSPVGVPTALLGTIVTALRA